MATSVNIKLKDKEGKEEIIKKSFFGSEHLNRVVKSTFTQFFYGNYSRLSKAPFVPFFSDVNCRLTLKIKAPPRHICFPI